MCRCSSHGQTANETKFRHLTYMKIMYGNIKNQTYYSIIYKNIPFDVLVNLLMGKRLYGKSFFLTTLPFQTYHIITVLWKEATLSQGENDG